MKTFTVCTILVFCCLAIGCGGWAYKVGTENMLPTIQVGDICLINKLDGSPIKRFDLIVFDSPEKDYANNILLSRVVGLPNEEIEIKNNQIFVNDKLIKEDFEIMSVSDYLGNLPLSDFPKIKILDKHYFILGDNRNNSWDSRYWKEPTISGENIKGKVAKIVPTDK